MKLFSRQIYPNADETTWAAAEKIQRLVARAAEQKERVSIALSGGGTPLALYRLLADPAHGFRDKIPWKQLHFFWSDERFVPHDDAQSNFKAAWDAMLSKVGVPEENIHRYRTELGSPEAAADDYQKRIEAFFGANPLQPPPRFDLILLGMGADGHTASLFPGLPLLHASNHWIKAFWVPQMRSHRMCGIL